MYLYISTFLYMPIILKLVLFLSSTQVFFHINLVMQCYRYRFWHAGVTLRVTRHKSMYGLHLDDCQQLIPITSCSAQHLSRPIKIFAFHSLHIINTLGSHLSLNGFFSF